MNIEIRPANDGDIPVITHIGRLSVELAHRGSCSPTDMESFLDEFYNEQAIAGDLANIKNNYSIMLANNKPIGFLNIQFNSAHPNLQQSNCTKLDRIYLLSDYHDRKLGFLMLQHCLQQAQLQAQCGVWLFTWQDNERAVNFYKRSGFKIIAEHRFKVTETHYNPHYQMWLEL